MNILGDTPKSFCVLASCDHTYLLLHAPAFIASCAVHHMPVHLHIINPTDDDMTYARGLRRGFDKLTRHGIPMTISYETTYLARYDAEQRRTYYACNRFLVAPELMEKSPGLSLLISDIDCVFMKHMDQPTDQLGLFFREPLAGTNEWETEGSRVAAGLVYYRNDMIEFAQEVAWLIDIAEKKWFLDQFALNKTYKRWEVDEVKRLLSIRQFTSKTMDWEFVEGSTIWTGKGPRKYDNPTYVGMKQKFQDMLPKDPIEAPQHGIF